MQHFEHSRTCPINLLFFEIIVKDLIHELKHQSLKHSHRDETNLQNYVQLQQRLTIEATIQSLIENLAKDQINTLKYRIRLE